MSTVRFGCSLRDFHGLAAVLLLSLAATVFSFPAQSQHPSATYREGKLSVTIPYGAAHGGWGKLAVEILDPEDHTLNRAQQRLEIREGNGQWQQTIVPSQPIAFEDILWQRVRYQFVYDDANLQAIEGIESISEIMRRPVVHILGQKGYLAGSQTAIRVIVTDAATNTAQTGTVRIQLVAPGHESVALFSGNLNRHGTLNAGFRFPAGLTGDDQLRFVVDTPIGSTEYTQPVHLEDKAAILVTTEKPVYQPSQTIHARALALDRAAGQAAANRNLTFEVEDPRGNKVFRKAVVTDKFGIASAEFALADEVNLGTYRLRALMGSPAVPANTVEISFQVERYVLPKFKVTMDFTQKDNKPRRDYRPGDHVTGTVQASYFFGKPVDHAEVDLKASGADVAVFQAASAIGKTDSDGAWHFDLKLPDYFAGRPLSQGSARALIEATVKDSADHAETHGEPITISQSPLLITAVPEGGTLIPGIENEVFLLAAYPDGTPASATLTVHPPANLDHIPYVGEAEPRDQRLTTDSSGIAILRINPGPGLAALHIDADDHRGNRTTSTVALESRSGADQILLHTDKAIFKPGDRIQLRVLSSHAQGAVYIDIVKSGQTLLTRDLDLKNGEGELDLAATPEMAGTLDIDAYQFGSNAQPVSDHRLVFVQPAEELKIDTVADAAVYRPGSDARIQFHVTNSHGEGVQAALGVQVVDEAVFALAESSPGFAKVFFYLEQETMKPRYEIHSLSMDSVVESHNAIGGEQENLAARALFSATEIVNPSKVDIELGRSLPQEKFAAYRERYRAAFTDQVRELAARLSRQIGEDPDGAKIEKAFAMLENGATPRDAWNTALHIEPTGRFSGVNDVYEVRSAGPDGRFDSADDLIVYIEDRSGAIAGAPGRGGSLDLRIEHDRGPVNDRAQIAGRVADASGAVIPGATITLRQLSIHDTRNARSDADGYFNFAGLPTGSYRIDVAAMGFRTASRDLTLAARDRGVLSAVLHVGEVTQQVEVTTAAQLVTTEAVAVGGLGIGAGGGFGMGMAAGLATGANPSPVAAAGRFNGGAIDNVSNSVVLKGQSFALLSSDAAPDAPRVRTYFPEALYINPEIITDGNGNASISIPIADSITTWRMALLASTQSGALGSASSSLKVFQDFFVDLDLPVTLTQGDRVSIPVAIYDYSGNAGQVSLKLEPGDWYALDNDTPEKTIPVESGRIGSSQFTLKVNRIGKFKLTLSAQMRNAQGAVARQDIVVREIEVVPNGQEQNIVLNGRLESSVQHDLKFPATSIPDATSILVRLYPGPMSQIVEGMDSILRMPNGCFEQTSSSTYPNVLALDYMKRTNKITPEIHAKAEGYIASGYQRLLTFEVPAGGFSWFGQAPANKILTAYGLMEFNDMAKVLDVDPRLIQRTAQWLAGQQQADGSWKPDASFINEGATNRYNSDILRITAYIAWSLANTGYQGPAIEKAKSYIESHADSGADTYTLAVIANFAADYGKDREFTNRSMQALIDARTEKDDQVSWKAEATGVYSTGMSAVIETTGLATQALLKWGQASEIARKALNFISSKKDASGNWGTTQATIMALRALLLSTELSASDVAGSVEVVLNGKPVESLKLDANNSDLLHQFVFSGIDPLKPASVQLNFNGSGTLAYQVVGRYFTPWQRTPPSEPLTIDVTYDRTRLAQNDIATATATIRNNQLMTANMVMVDLGIPPGFDLLSEDLQAFQEKTAGQQSGLLEKFSLTATQAILYFNALSQNQTVILTFRLRAKYPIRANSFESRVYEYYDPDVSFTAHPVQFEITADR